MRLRVDILQVDQVTESYVNWFSNKEIVQYSVNQYKKFSFEGQCSYVESCLKNNDLDLYGIFDDTLHIGNIAINNLTTVHRRAELTYVVGDTRYWGKGVASFAVSKMVELGKSKYKLNKLHASLDSSNFKSKKVLEKNGFVLEGIRKKHLFYNKEFFDQLDYGLIL
jgi:RimJ/RimL family protein N-acetyltransferase|tara:strand:+ start:2963 stop:3460 length:498 start_codon:yes stop_codon:yes gene_type:complete